MRRLLHIIASPNGAASRSTRVAEAFLESYRRRHRECLVDSVNVWDLDMPAFDATMIAAKFAVLRTEEATGAQRRKWTQAVKLSESFNSADVDLFSLPMWNFGVPYPLNHYIAVVTLPGGSEERRVEKECVRS